MKATPLALTLAAALSGVAAPCAAEPPSAALEAAYANTVVSTYPDGRTAKLWLQPDGTYRGQGRRGKPSSGKWKVEGERICFRQSRPIPVPKSFCTPLPATAVGVAWPAKAVTGEPVRVELVKGR